MSVLVKDTVFWNRWSGEIYTGDLLVESGPRGGILPAGPDSPDADEVVDAAGALSSAGLACCHHHIYSALARGMPAPPRSPKDFAEILELIWWRLDKALDLEMIRASALATAMDALRCGVTRIVDHHASPHAVTGSLDALAEGLDSLGIAHALCYELSDRDGPESAAQGLAETDAWLAAGRPGHVGLHASFTVGDDLLRRAVDLARKHGTGLHVHVAEDEMDQRHCLATHGCRVVERLHRAGALDLPGTLLVHGLHLDDRERSLIDRSEAWLVQNPESNWNNAVGEFRDDGLPPDRLLIGTDGMHSDMLRSFRAAFYLAQSQGGSGFAAAEARLKNNHHYLEQHLPAVARTNDLVLLDYPAPTPLTEGNVLGHALFGIDARHVRSVIADGRVLLRDGGFTTVDEHETLTFCREQAQRLWERLAAV